MSTFLVQVNLQFDALYSTEEFMKRFTIVPHSTLEKVHSKDQTNLRNKYIRYVTKVYSIYAKFSKIRYNYDFQ